MKKSLLILCAVTAMLLGVGCEEKLNIMVYPRNGLCAIDTPVRNAEILFTNEFQVAGWSFNKVSGTVPNALTLVFRNTKNNKIVNVAAKTNYSRPDVVKAVNNPAVEFSGFGVIMPKESLPKGEYEILLMQSDPHAGAIICDNESHFIKIK